MTRGTLHFQSIEIRRMPGFPRGGLKVVDLCPGVNVIYGPNASGKTTLGRAIQQLLRPKDRISQRASLTASLEKDGTALALEYDMGSLRCQRREDGVPTDYPNLAPPEIGSRHVLALHDLVHSANEGKAARENNQLAGEIVRELAGGYDVAEAKNSLGYRETPLSKGKAAKELETARIAVRQAMAGQEELLARQQSLSGLRSDKDRAESASARLSVLDKALEHAAARAEVERCRLRVERFPKGVEKTTEHDVEQLDRLQQTIAEADNRRRDEQRKLADARQAKQACDLPEEGVPAHAVEALRKKCQRLDKLSENIRREKGNLDRAVAQADEARRRIGPEVSVEQANGLDSATVEELFTFARGAEKLRAGHEAKRTLADWLGTDPPPEDIPSLDEGIRLLRQWLVEHEAASARNDGHRQTFTVMGVLTGVVSIVMGLAVHASWWLLLAVAGGWLAWAFWPRNRADRTEEIRRDYDNLGVGAPDPWDVAGVSRYARELQQRHDESTLRREKALKWGDLDNQIVELEEEQQRFDGQKGAWTERLGIDADASEAELALLADNIRRLAQAQHDAAAAQSDLDGADEAYRALLREINGELAPLGFEPGDDPETVGARVEALNRRRESHEAAVRQVADASNALDRLAEDGRKASEELTALFDRVGLTSDEEPELRQWAGIRREYDEATRKTRNAEDNLQSLRQALADHADLLQRSAEELEKEKRQCAERAERLTKISEEIGAIGQDVDRARQSTDLEARLALQRQCEDALGQQRQQDYDALLGNVLADHIAHHEQETELPAVLRRARELFAKITHGRYELHVDQGNPPEFRALETAGRVGLALEELSSGTRLQLLLAVRVAFVERQEQGVTVPLILDETLGNSDERRAREIIDAVIEICRDGRQVFYFTAQHDEVGKWRELLRSYDDVPSHEIDLAEVRQFSHTERVPPIEFEAPEPVTVPPPEGTDWREYGRRLNVPPIDPRGSSGEVHLWYLIDDVSTLYRLLKGGANKWGQFRTLVSYHQIEGISRESDVYRRAEAAVELIAAASRHWQTGRGLPVDRQALADSGAVSETYLDRVCELAGELSGNAKALIDALRAGSVKGFRTDKRNELAEYLAAEGYLDEDDVLTAEQIRERTRLATFSAIDTGLITPERFERLVAAVCAPA
ncbi:MAG: hypothetical protein HQ581_22790 [Planctomycetes bacterium]|nr:hypothetical protein [Planctomycetota bacterium]